MSRVPRAPLDLRLVPAAVLAWAGCWWAVAAPARVAWGVAAVLAFVAVAPVGARSAWRLVGRQSPRDHRGRRGDPAGRWAAAALALAVGAVALGGVALRVERRAEGPVPGWAGQRAAVVVVGTLAGDPERSRASAGLPDDRAVFTVRLSPESVIARGTVARAGGPLLVIGGPDWEGLAAGSRVRAAGRLAAAEPGDPTIALLMARRAPETLDHGSWWWRVAERLRVGLRTACEGLPADAGGLLPGLVVGDTSRLPPDLEEEMRSAGLTHLTAVSGSNVSLVAGAALVGAAFAGAGRRARALVALAAVGGFVILARPEPSVLRAGVMGALGLAGLLMARGGKGVPLLCGATVLLLLADPWLARAFGFALSVLATAALVVLVPAWLERAPPRVPRWAAAAVAVPIAAFVVTAPVTVLLQPTVSVVAIPANLLAAPAVAPATVLGVAAAAVAVVWPFGAHLLAWGGALATGWIALVARTAAAVPGGTVPWAGGLPGAVALAAVMTLLVLRVSLRPSPGASQRRPRLRPGAGSLVAALVVGWFAVPRVPGWPGESWPPAGWWAVQCDVGQGDALVVRSGPGRAVLVDAGPDPALVDGCLDRLGVERLDLVLVTHFHADHADGLPGAVEDRPTAAVLVSPLAEPAGPAAQVRRTVARAGARLVVGGAGTHGRAGDVTWRLVWPAPPGDGGAVKAGNTDGGEEGSGPNDASLVAVIEVRGRTLVALGDVEPEAQAPLRRALTGVDVDVVKVAHHGSSRQDRGLYAGLRAEVALIGVGRENDYGHPSPRALSMLDGLGAVVLRTDADGDVAVVGTGGGGDGEGEGVVRRGVSGGPGMKR